MDGRYTDVTPPPHVPNKKSPVALKIYGLAPQDLKHPKGHPNGPTPQNSPQKKRTRVKAADTSSPPPPKLLFPQPLSEPSTVKDDVFGSASIQTALGGGKTRDGTLFSFWTNESEEEKTKRNCQDFEELRNTHERREFEDARMKAKQKDRERACARQRQSTRRDKVRNLKVANGWKPTQKRVSLNMFEVNKTHIDCSTEISRGLR